MRSEELSAWLMSIEAASHDTNIIIVPGGGEFADSVRSLQKHHGFDDLTAHKMALLAMCQYGYLLAGVNSNCKIIEDISNISPASKQKQPFIWLPTALLEDNSEILPNWDFTSDSIALWLATKISATKLVLVKSIILDGAKTSIREHIKRNELDEGFQQLSDYYSGKISLFGKSEYKKFI